MHPTLQHLKARAHHTARIIYWRVRLMNINRRLRLTDEEIRDQLHAEWRAQKLQLIEVERRQEGLILQRQAMDRLDALTLGPREPEPEPATPRRRHHEQPQA